MFLFSCSERLKVIKIGIVGSDNSHALAFAKLANVAKVAGDRCRVVGIWGQEEERTREVAEQGQIINVVDKPQDLLALVDMAFVVDRHGDLHADHALPFLEEGLPVFVDKPFAINLKDCEKMLSVARRTGALLTSFSSLRYAPSTEALAEDVMKIGNIKAAHFSGPCDFGSEYGGAFFYATHVAEIALRLLGEEVESLRAFRSDNTVAAQVVWSDGALATFTYLGDAAYHFHASLFGSECMAASEITSGNGKSYERAFQIVLDMVESECRPLTEEQLLRPIAIVHAMYKSLDSRGERVDITPIIKATE